VVAAVLATASGASAHGVWGHIHVTGWAIEELSPGELHDFFADPEVFNAALFGAAYTDSGYSQQAGGALYDAAHAYSEHTHWEPYIQDFVTWIRENDPPPWTTQESKKRVAFMLGNAAHGMQDELFDSLFLPQVERRDSGDQGNADPASDGFLALDGLLTFLPTPYIPLDTVLALYADLPQKIDAETIQKSVDLLTGAYVNDVIGKIVAEELGKEHAPDLVWMRQHYMDPAVPGSLASEITPTARYMQAIWSRLHDQLGPGDAVIYTFPEQQAQLLGRDHTLPDSWVTTVYGIGVQTDSVTATWTGDDGDVPFDQMGTRWGATWTRLHRFQPTASLTAGAWYDLTLTAGLTTITNESADVPFTLTLQAPCDDAEDAACRETPVPVADTTDVTAEPTAPTAPGATGCIAGSSRRTIPPLTAVWLVVTLLGIRLFHMTSSIFPPV